MALMWCVCTNLVQLIPGATADVLSAQNRRAMNGKADTGAGFHLNALVVHNMHSGLVGAAINVVHSYRAGGALAYGLAVEGDFVFVATLEAGGAAHFKGDRKSTRLNSSHVRSSYAVFCLKKKIYQRGPQFDSGRRGRP